MINKGDKLVRYELDESYKILYEDVEIQSIDNDKIVVRDDDNFIHIVDPDMINDQIQDNGYFYMTSEVFMKAYMLFEKKIQLDKVMLEDDLRRVIEAQARFYKVNSSEKDTIIRSTREERERTKSMEPIIPIFDK